MYRGQDPYLGCVTLIEDRILPLTNIQSDQRSIQNQKIQEMIQELEND